MEYNDINAIYGLLTFLIATVVVLIAITILPYWKIYQKTGQSGALSLLLLIPLVNIIMLYVLAFTEWPIEAELKKAREREGQPGQSPLT